LPTNTTSNSDPIDHVSDAMSELLTRINSGWGSENDLGGDLLRYRSGDILVGPEFDGLSECAPIEHWDDVRRELHFALRSIKPRRRFAVLTMARDEALHLPEWIAHYLSIGADHIFVYTNDNRDGTDEQLRWFAENAPVTPLFTKAAPGVDIQRKNYQHAFFLLPELRLFDWVLVVDVDEFLIPAPRFNYRLTALLDAAPADAAAIVFPWLWRLWDRGFERTPGLLAERYEHALPHALCKSAVRLNHATSLCEIHIPTLDEGAKLLDSSFTPIAAKDIWTDSRKSFEGGWIDHYWGRSFEEFVIKKTRGDSLAIPSGLFQRDYEIFFSWTAAYSEQNLSPVPEAIVAGIQAKMAEFNRDPVFRALIAKASAFYDEHAATLKKDLALVALYQDLFQKIAPDFVASP
jgi:hypothetical protein